MCVEPREPLLSDLRYVRVPLLNGGMATFPVPMTNAEYTLIVNILHDMKAIHVRELAKDGE